MEALIGIVALLVVLCAIDDWEETLELGCGCAFLTGGIFVLVALVKFAWGVLP